MANHHYGETVQQIQARIAERNARIAERHANAYKGGYEDECYVGLSAWAENMDLSLLNCELDLAKNGWTAEFDVLCDASGAEVPCRTIKTRFGTAVALVDANDRFTGQFVKPGSDRSAKKFGLHFETRSKPAKAVVAGSGTGLSGCASACVTVVRLDNK